MLYSKQITVSANTTEANSSKTRFKVNRGIVYRCWLSFPPGCVGLVKLRILHEGHPFIPIEANAYIRGDDYVFELPMFYEITEEPQLITVEVWNEDDTYEHTVDVMLLILPKEFVLPVGATEGIMKSLSSLIINRPII